MEAQLLSCGRSEVKEIQKELMRMKSFLEDADVKHHKDARILKRVNEVKDLCYKIEDVIETFSMEGTSNKSRNGIKRVLKMVSCFLHARHKLGTDIATTKKSINSLETYYMEELHENSAKEKQWWLRQTYAHAADQDFVGLQDEILGFVSLIVDTNKHHKVVFSIWGMGGLGKTALARKIYNHAKIKLCFEAFAWVCITQHCQIKVVLQDILKQLGGETIGLNETGLVRKLNEIQSKKNCLVVLDDVWETEHWEILRGAFPIADRAASSKILLTTRKKQVAEKGYLLELRNLTEEESWQLLQKIIVFPVQEEKDIKIDGEFEDVGKKVVRKCGNLPLAISLIGGILKGRNTLSGWQMVYEKIDVHLGRGEVNRQTSGSIEHALALSYDDLPYNLKQCFLYMGIFQEDKEIEARELCHLWIAEGIVSLEHRGKEESLMDVAESNLDALASCSMVQVQMDNLSRRIKSCKLHVLMRDLCLKKGKEEKFLESFDMDAMEGTSPFRDIVNVRRLAIYSAGRMINFDGIPLDQMSNQNLRTLFVHYGTLHGSPNSRLCRVLSLENCSFPERKLSKEIHKMVHLRYFSLRNCVLDQLPSFVRFFSYLETFDLRTSVYSELEKTFGIHLPNVFSEMKRLRHLYFPVYFYSRAKKLQLTGLRELETLVGFKSELFRHEDLSDLINLRHFEATLGRDNWSGIIDQIDCRKKIRWFKVIIEENNLHQVQLEKLLKCQNLNDLEICGTRIGLLPLYVSQFWQNLMRLKFHGTKIHEVSVKFLKKLPNLRELVLCSESIAANEFI